MLFKNCLLNTVSLFWGQDAREERSFTEEDKEGGGANLSLFCLDMINQETKGITNLFPALETGFRGELPLNSTTE